MKDLEKELENQIEKKESSFIGDTYIRRKNGDDLVLRAGLKLAICWIVFLMLAGLYAYVYFIEPIIPEVGENNTVELKIPKNASYALCEDEEINSLVGEYLRAKVACNQDILMDSVTDTSEFEDMTLLEYVSIYLRGFDNITCYIADGYASGEYIVIALSNMRIANVDSHPLDIVTFYIITDEDGNYKIDNQDLDDARATFLAEFKAADDIQKIYIHVKESVEYYLTVDEDFQDFYSLIYG